ncbi:unnamed protein product [Ixodes pacificus]
MRVLGGGVVCQARRLLAAEPVQGTSLSLQRVDDVHGGDRFPLGVFRVGDGVADHVLQEDFEHASGLLVDQTRDTLDATTASQTTNGGLCDSLDVVSKHLAMTLGASFSEPLASFATARHLSNQTGTVY